MKKGVTFFPTPHHVDAFHTVIIAQRGERGYISKGLVEGSLRWATTNVYDFRPFPSLFEKAGAIMYAIITFHPFADGNKRTALMTTSFFLHLNGYDFEMPDDSPEFARELAERSLDEPDHAPQVEVARISKWLEENASTSLFARIGYKLMASRAMKLGYSEDLFLDEKFIGTRLSWFVFVIRYLTWLGTTISDLLHLLRK